MSVDLRQATASALKQYQKQLVVTVISDRLNHAEVLAAGAFKWRLALSRDISAFWNNNRAGCDDLADSMFRFFEWYWQKRYLSQEHKDFDGLTPTQFLNAVHVPSPLSEKEVEKEIEDGWELEIASDEKTMNTMYEGSARTRKGGDLGVRKVH